MAPKDAVFAVVLVTSLVVGASACLGGSSQASSERVGGRSVLRVAFGPDDGSHGLVVFRLGCDPPTGTVPHPSAVCSTLSGRPELVLPKPTNVTCSPGIGGWAVAITGVYEGASVRTGFGSCSPQVGAWMRLSGYRPCPQSFIEFNCHHGPYAFGKAHYHGIYPTVPNVVGMTARRGRSVLIRRGLVPIFAASSHLSKLARHALVRAQSPRAGASVSVYTHINLTLTRRRAA